MSDEKSILILGLFVDASAKTQSIRAAEDRIAVMFQRYDIKVITSSSANGKRKRLIETISALIQRRSSYKAAIVPLFGTTPGFLWQETVTRLLKLFNKKIILGIHGGSIPGKIDRGDKRFFMAIKRADILFAPSSYFSLYLKQKGF